MFLRAGLFRSARARAERWPHFLRLRYPTYWHYDVLYGLRVLADVGAVGDPRAAEALDRVAGHRGPDGRWAVDGTRWRGIGTNTASEVVDWGRSGPNKMLTLHAARVLQAAGWTDG